MTTRNLETILLDVLKEYQRTFSEKEYAEESAEVDPLMQVFGITQQIKMGNRQYWGRELGSCFEKIVKTIFRALRPTEYSEGYKEGDDELNDLCILKKAIDTKYRCGSGDSGTLKKFKQYGKKLANRGYEPIMLILRDDNLSAAITAMKTGGWTVLTGTDTFRFIYEQSGFDLKTWLEARKDAFIINK